MRASQEDRLAVVRLHRRACRELGDGQDDVEVFKVISKGTIAQNRAGFDAKNLPKPGTSPLTDSLYLTIFLAAGDLREQKFRNHRNKNEKQMHVGQGSEFIILIQALLNFPKARFGITTLKLELLEIEVAYNRLMPFLRFPSRFKPRCHG